MGVGYRYGLGGGCIGLQAVDPIFLAVASPQGKKGSIATTQNPKMWGGSVQSQHLHRYHLTPNTQEEGDGVKRGNGEGEGEG